MQATAGTVKGICSLFFRVQWAKVQSKLWLWRMTRKFTKLVLWVLWVMSYSVKSLKEYRKLLKPISCFIMKVRCSLGNFHAPVFVADFPPVAPEFHQCTHRVHLRIGHNWQKIFSQIRHRKIPREHIDTGGSIWENGSTAWPAGSLTAACQSW